MLDRTPLNTPSESPSSLALRQAAEVDQALKLALVAVEAAADRKGADIRLLCVSEVSYLADYFLVVTGFSNVQVRAIARSIADAIETQLNRYPERTEGLQEGSWVLQDYGEVIVHIFLPQARDFYNLEAFWGHAKVIDISGAMAEADRPQTYSSPASTTWHYPAQ